MSKPWAQVESDPDFLGLPEGEQLKVRQAYVDKAAADPAFQQLPPEEQTKVKTRILPASTAPSPNPLKAAAAPFQTAATGLQDKLTGVAKAPGQALEDLGARWRAGAATEIPGLKQLSELKESAPDVGSAIAKRLAASGVPPTFHGIPIRPEVGGMLAGAVPTAIDAAIPSVKTVGDAQMLAAQTAAMAYGIPAVKDLVPRALPILGEPVENVGSAIARKLGWKPAEPTPAPTLAPAAAPAPSSAETPLPEKPALERAALPPEGPKAALSGKPEDPFASVPRIAEIAQKVNAPSSLEEILAKDAKHFETTPNDPELPQKIFDMGRDNMKMVLDKVESGDANPEQLAFLQKVYGRDLVREHLVAGSVPDELVDAYHHIQGILDSIDEHKAGLLKEQAEQLKQDYGGSMFPVTNEVIAAGGLDSDLLNKNYRGEMQDFKPRPGVFVKGGVAPDQLANSLSLRGLLPEGASSDDLFQALQHEHVNKKPLFIPRSDYVPPEVDRPGQGGYVRVGAPETPPPAPGEPGARSGDRVLYELNQMKEKPAPEMTVAERLKDAKLRVKTQLFDHLAPLEELSAAAQKTLGRPFTAEEDAYVQASLFPGIKGIMESEANKWAAAVEPAARAGLTADLDNYLHLRQFIKRVDDLTARAQGFVSTGEKGPMQEGQAILDKIANNEANPLSVSKAEAQRGLEALQQKLGPQNFGYLEQQAGKLYEQMRDVLTQAKDAGLVSQDGFDAIAARGKDYTPIEVLDHVAEEQGGAPPQSLSARYQDIVKTMEGTTKETRAALPSHYSKVMRGIVAIERQKVFQSVQNIGEIPGMEKTVFEIPQGAKVPKGYEPYYGFRDGQRVTLALPEGVGSALSGLGTKEMGLLGNMLSHSAAAFKAGTTHLNLAFVTPHTLRFVKDMAFLSKTGIPLESFKDAAMLPINTARFAGDLFGAAAHVLTKDDTFQEVLRSRGLYSGVQENITPEAFIKGLSKKSIEDTAAQSTAKAIPAIVRAIDNIPKVAAYTRARRMGMSPDAAALETRRFGGAPDYAMHGASMPEINALMPFTNVRAQVAYRTALAAERDPGQMMAKVALLTTIAAARYAFNHRDKSTATQYDELNKTEKLKKNIYMLGSNYTTAEGKANPKYVTIPKTELEQAIDSGVHGVLDAYTKAQGRDAAAAAFNAFSSFSPVPMRYDSKDKLAAMGSSMASGLNPALRAPLELLPADGFDTFRNTPLTSPSVMERQPYARFTPRTSPAAEAIGRYFAKPNDQGTLEGGFSPIKIEQAAGLAGGGLGRGALDLAGSAMRLAGKAPASQVTGWEAATQTPGLNRLIGHLEPKPDVLDKMLDFKREHGMDKATAAALADQAIQEYLKSKHPDAQLAMRQALVGAAHVDPSIPEKAFAQAIRQQLHAGNVPKAYDVFMSMDPGEQAGFMRQLRSSEDGLAMRAQLVQEFHRRPKEAP